MATMDHQVRSALKLLGRYDQVSRADFSLQHVGIQTIDLLVESGWAEQFASPTGKPLYRITHAGRAKAVEPLPEKPPKRGQLKELPPRIKPLPPRL